MKQYKINSQRLSRIIMSRHHLKAQKSLLEIYESLTVAQREELRLMLSKK